MFSVGRWALGVKSFPVSAQVEFRRSAISHPPFPIPPFIFLSFHLFRPSVSSPFHPSLIFSSLVPRPSVFFVLPLLHHSNTPVSPHSGFPPLHHSITPLLHYSTPLPCRLYRITLHTGTEADPSPCVGGGGKKFFALAVPCRRFPFR